MYKIKMGKSKDENLDFRKETIDKDVHVAVYRELASMAQWEDED